MTKRAVFTKADLKRAASVARESGLKVVIENGVISLLPLAPVPAKASHTAGDNPADTDWDKALGL
jgi:hypothetical protein